MPPADEPVTQEVLQRDHYRTVTAIKVQVFCYFCKTPLFKDDRFPSPYYRTRNWYSICKTCEKKIIEAHKEWPQVSAHYRRLNNRLTSRRQQLAKYPDNPKVLAAIEELQAELEVVNQRRLELKALKKYIKYVDTQNLKNLQD